MEQGRVSTIRFNEWICVCAQYEKAVARLGRQVYQGYSRGLVRDHQAVEMCKEISQAFGDSKQIRADMEEELERDALHGLSVEEAKAAEEILELTQGEKIMRNIKLQVTKFLGRGAVNRSLQSYRDRVRDLSRDLGLRALAVYEKDEPVLKLEGHKRLCQLALNLDAESNKKWDEITKSKTESGGLNLSFHTQLISFIASFASFSRGTAIGKMLLKALKYDAREEEKKLTKQFEGSKTAEALEAQMAEVDEPDMDIGREMATMERDYVTTPTEWGLPPRTNDDAWIPDTSDTWSSTVEEAPPKPAALRPNTPVPAMPPKPGAVGSGDGPKPQVLRQRRPSDSLSGAEAWAMGNSAPPAPSEPEAWSAPAGPTRIGQAPAPTASSPAFESMDDDWGSAPVSTSQAEAPVEDWAADDDEAEEDWGSEPAAPAVDDWAAEPLEDDTPIGPVRLGGHPTLSGGSPLGVTPPPSRTPTIGGGAPPAHPGGPARPAAPPARPHGPARPQAPAASGPGVPPPRPHSPQPGQAPQAPRTPQPPVAPPRPARPAPPPGMVAPAAQARPGGPPPGRPLSPEDIPRLPISSQESLASIPMPGRHIPTESMISAPRLPITHDSIAFSARGAAGNTNDDPLLKLLRNESAQNAQVNDDDDLLPAFLRERKDDDLDEAGSFIPDLPDSLDSGLKILPFGSQPKKGDEPPEPFIPQMPD